MWTHMRCKRGLDEPAGSVHTLTVPATNDGLTDVWFTISGANLHLDAEGRLELVIDAHGIIPFYVAMCVDPPVYVIAP